jgi:hypothetical protein
MVRHAPPDLWFDPYKNNSRLLAAMSELRAPLHACRIHSPSHKAVR